MNGELSEKETEALIQNKYSSILYIWYFPFSICAPPSSMTSAIISRAEIHRISTFASRLNCDLRRDFLLCETLPVELVEFPACLIRLMTLLSHQVDRCPTRSFWLGSSRRFFKLLDRKDSTVERRSSLAASSGEKPTPLNLIMVFLSSQLHFFDL